MGLFDRFEGASRAGSKKQRAGGGFYLAAGNTRKSVDGAMLPLLKAALHGVIAERGKEFAKSPVCDVRKNEVHGDF
jgi:hypothetical protein